MILARVTGTLVATQKNRKLEGAKLLLVQPLTLEDTPRGPSCSRWTASARACTRRC